MPDLALLVNLVLSHPETHVDAIIGPAPQPMKRDERLQPLSRDHHEALVLARALRWAVEDDSRAPRDPVALLRGAWGEMLDSHFRAEEELLLPLMETGEAERFRRELAKLRGLCVDLLEGEVDDERLAAFSTALHVHVRWEERLLFPRLERDSPRGVLDAVGRRLEAVEATRPRERDL